MNEHDRKQVEHSRTALPFFCFFSDLAMFQVFPKLVGIMYSMIFLKRVFLLDSMDAISCGDDYMVYLILIVMPFLN